MLASFGIVCLVVESFFILFSGCDGKATEIDLTNGDPRNLQKQEVIFLSPTACQGNHGVWRWDAKTDGEVPPDAILEANQVTPIVVGSWPDLQGRVTKATPRSGREKLWYQLTGRLTVAKAEADGDIHLMLQDVSGSGPEVVVEIPLGEPWDQIRTRFFNEFAPDQKFPFTLGKDTNWINLSRKPILRITGKAFWDGEHKGHNLSNRRGGGVGNVTVWEIHPVMTMDEVQSSNNKEEKKR
jgi:hypothetical protein